MMVSESTEVSSAFSVIVTQIQPQAHKITLKGVYTLAAYEVLQEKISLLTIESKKKQMY